MSSTTVSNNNNSNNNTADQSSKLPKHEIQWYGQIPDRKDIRDQYYQVTRPKALPPVFDLTKDNGGPDSKYPIQDQGALGSCTGNGIAAILAVCDIINDMKAGRPQDQNMFMPSRLFIYYNERVMEGTVNSDSGAMIRDGIKSVNRLGACREELCKYDIQKFTQKPSKDAYDNAKYHQAIKYQRINSGDINTMKSVLASGFPFTFGFSVYDSFESDAVSKTGIVPMPQKTERLLGGHCVVAVGYDDAGKMFKCRNSWGTDWGDHGYFYMPYSYMQDSNLVNDIWFISLIEESDK